MKTQFSMSAHRMPDIRFEDVQPGASDRGGSTARSDAGRRMPGGGPDPDHPTDHAAERPSIAWRLALAGPPAAEPLALDTRPELS